MMDAGSGHCGPPPPPALPVTAGDRASSPLSPAFLSIPGAVRPRVWLGRLSPARQPSNLNSSMRAKIVAGRQSAIWRASLVTSNPFRRRCPSMGSNLSRGDLTMGQNHLTKKARPMTDAAMIPPGYEAAEWADKLIAKAHRGPGDTVDAAMHRVSTKHRIDHGTLWRLRYRRPKDVMTSVWKQLKAAYEAEVERQEARLAHELELTKNLRGPNASPSPAEVEAEALLAARHGAPEEA